MDDTPAFLAGFLARCDRYLEATGWTETRLSMRLFGDDDWLGRVRGGADTGVRRLSRASRRLTELEITLSREGAQTAASDAA